MESKQNRKRKRKSFRKLLPQPTLGVLHHEFKRQPDSNEEFKVSVNKVNSKFVKQIGLINKRFRAGQSTTRAEQNADSRDLEQASEALQISAAWRVKIDEESEV